MIKPAATFLKKAMPSSILVCLVIPACALLLPVAADGDILFSDTFTYDNGDLTSRSSGIWTAFSNGQTDLPILVFSGEARIAPGSAVSTGRQDVYGVLSSTVSSGMVYYGFDYDQVNTTSIPSGSAQYMITLTNSTSSQGVGNSRLYSATSSTGSNFSLGLGSTALGATVATGQSYNTTYRVVVGFNTTTGGLSLWVDPASSSSAADLTFAGTAQSVSYIELVQNVGSYYGTINVDNLVVATTLAEAIGSSVPEPATYGLWGAVGAFCFAVSYRRRRVRK